MIMVEQVFKVKTNDSLSFLAFCCYVSLLISDMVYLYSASESVNYFDKGFVLLTLSENKLFVLLINCLVRFASN